MKSRVRDAMNGKTSEQINTFYRSNSQAINKSGYASLDAFRRDILSGMIRVRRINKDWDNGIDFYKKGELIFHTDIKNMEFGQTQANAYRSGKFSKVLYVTEEYYEKHKR